MGLAGNPRQGSGGAEVPLGEGDVGMETYLRTLHRIGYHGPLTIEREIPHEPERQKQDIGRRGSTARRAADESPRCSERWLNGQTNRIGCA